jgi:hypothetical protein
VAVTIPAGPVVRLPYAFGQIVYHRARREKMAGMVTGFSVRAGSVYALVTWGEDLREGAHLVFELTTEFEPSYSEETDP